MAKTKKPLTLSERRRKIRDRYERPVVIYETDKELKIPTRFPMLNRLFGGGIIPGSIIEMYGFEDSAKSSLAIAIAADIQAFWDDRGVNKKHVVLVNYEGPQPWKWWITLKLDVRTLNDKGETVNFTQLRPHSLEEGMADMVDLIQSGEVGCVIVDSVYAASAKDSKDIVKDWRDPKKSGQAGGGGMAVEARQWGKAWTAFKTVFMEHEVVVIAVNQQRDDISTGGPPRKSWMGKKTTTPRGHALKFYAWIRMELKGSFLPDLPDGLDGRKIKIRVIKNKTTEESRGKCEYNLIRGVGFDLTSDLIDLSLQCGAIKGGGGGRFTLGSKKIHGRSKLVEIIESRPKLRKMLEAAVELYLSRKTVEEEEEEE